MAETERRGEGTRHSKGGRLAMANRKWGDLLKSDSVAFDCVKDLVLNRAHIQ